MTGFATMSMRLGRRLLAAFAMIAAVSLTMTPGLAQTGQTSVGSIVAVTATGGDIRAFGASVKVSGAAANVRAAGADVDVSAQAAGSVWAVGARIVIGGTVGADVSAAGSAADLEARVGGDAQVAGAVVNVNGTIGGNLRAAGATLTIGPQASVGGRLEAASGNLTMNGHVTGDARLAGVAVTFNGQADGSLILAGDKVVIGPLAHIAGNLTVYSRTAPEIASSAVIGGTTTQVAPPAEILGLPSWVWGVGLAAATVLSATLAGIVLLLFGGRLFLSAVDIARLKPMSTILVGFVTLILVPAIAGILAATGIGLPIALALLLALPLLFVFGYPVAAAGIAAGIFVRAPGPIGAARGLLFVILGAILISLIGLVPWVGALAVAVVVVLGVGALVRTAGGRLRASPERRAGPPAERRPPPPPRAEPPRAELDNLLVEGEPRS
jgi:hypothetical protein